MRDRQLARLRHVLYVVPTLGTGGAEVALARTARELGERGVAVTVAALGPPDAVAAQLRAAGATVHRLGPRGEPPAPLSIARLARLIRRTHPDVVHGHLYWGVLAAAAGLRLAGRRMPAGVATLHGVDYALWPSTTLARRLGRAAHLRVLRGSFDALLAVSPDVRDHYAGLLGRRGPEVRVVANGLPVEALRAAALARPADETRACLGVPPGARLVVTVGRLAEEKDQRTLLDALAQLRTAEPWFLVVAGDGPLAGSLRSHAERAGLAGRVAFAGSLPAGDVAALLGAADVFAFPSRHEGHGLALAEAMACGVACVASDTSGIRGLVDDGRTGRLHPVGDAARLAALLAELLEDAAQRARLGAAAGQAAAALDLPGAVDALLAEYQRVLAAPQRTGRRVIAGRAAGGRAGPRRGRP